MIFLFLIDLEYLSDPPVYFIFFCLRKKKNKKQKTNYLNRRHYCLVKSYLNGMTIYLSRPYA